MEPQFRLRSDLLEGAQPFSIDFGRSVLKLVYLTTDRENDSYTIIKCCKFTRAEFDSALEFIKHEIQLPQPSTPGGELPSMVMTGVSLYEFKSTIEKQLNVKPVDVWEAGCFSRAIRFLMEHVEDEELLFHRFGHTRDEEWHKFQESFRRYSVNKNPNSPEPSTVEAFTPRQWPMMIATLGSANLFRLYYENGIERNVHFSPKGGRAFLGLGSLLTDAKTYDELIELAKAGEDRHVHTYAKNLIGKTEKTETDKAEEKDLSGYGSLDIDLDIFNFGWAPGKARADFRREDLAKAVLLDLAQGTINDILHICQRHQVTNVLMCGGVMSDPYVRDVMEREFHHSQATQSEEDPGTPFTQAHMRTLIMGAYLGALGALLPPTK